MKHLPVEVTRLLILLGVVLVIIAITIFIPRHAQAPDSALQTQQAQQKTIPPPTADIQAQLAKSHGFNALVSYTDSGFEPATLTLQKGQTVRFTNNSSHDLWVGELTKTNTADNPNISNCGETPFNSCKVLKPGEFWEYTFYTTGTFDYQDNEHTSSQASIVIN